MAKIPEILRYDESNYVGSRNMQYDRSNLHNYFLFFIGDVMRVIAWRKMIVFTISAQYIKRTSNRKRRIKFIIDSVNE